MDSGTEVQILDKADIVPHSAHTLGKSIQNVNLCHILPM